MEKILTVSIAAYNVERFILNTLESLVIKRNMDKLEVIIINDGSIDQTPLIVEKYTNKYPNTFILINKDNSGYGSTINVSSKMARGKYFKQLDGDDWFQNDNLDDFIDYLEECNTDCVYSPFWKVYEKRNERVLFEANKKTKDLIIADDIFMHAFTFKTGLFLQNNIKITENCFYTDCEYNLKLLSFSNEISFYNKPIYCYRLEEEGQSVSYSGWKKHYKEHCKVTLELMSFFTLHEKNISEIYREAIVDYIIKIYKTNLNIALEIGDRSIRKEFCKLDKEVKKEFSQFYFLNNRKLKILRLFRYKVYGLLGVYHKLFEKNFFK